MNIPTQNNVSFKDAIAEFNNIRINGLSGNLVIQVADTPSWMLCFSSGRLAGISGGIDPIDRWRRNLALASLNAPLDRLVKSTNHQEIFLNSNKLAQECVAKEVLFDIIQFSQHKGGRLLYRFVPISDNNTQVKSILPLLEIQPILSASIQAWKEWEKHGLANYSPSLFPIIQKSSQVSDIDDLKDLQYIISSIDGNKSLRTLAIHHQRKLIDVAGSLVPLIKLGIITLSPLKQSSTDSDPVQTQQRAEISLPTGANSHRVLVIDDDRSIREVVSMCLHKLKNWDVLAVGSGQEGLDEIDTNSPDVIILDMMMPEMDGMAFLRKLRSNPQTKLIPVVLLTANRYLPDKDILTGLGVIETISKPFLPIDLVRQIDRALIKA